MNSLTIVRLRENKNLPELPPHYGPNTANMRHLYIQHINPQIIPPGSYFHQLPRLEELATSIDLNNDWTHLRILLYYGNLTPNFTGRTSTIVKIETNKAILTTRNIPDENVVGLSKLETLQLKSCDVFRELNITELSPVQLKCFQDSYGIPSLLYEKRIS